ncbi:MAG TPA: S8 family serine peptidase [Gaiellaceae bacterium]|nr:S8 family serine peptidase [Gaiellaceae bacterium]
MRRPDLLGRLVSVVTAVVAALVLAGTAAAAERYVVVYKQVKKTSASEMATDAARAGGTLVAAYTEIGVAVARSESPGFAKALDALRTVEGVAAVGALGSAAGRPLAGGPPPRLPNEPAADEDTFSPLQWWSQRVRAPEAHRLTGGSPEVTVGVIDSGVDAAHPDFEGAIDASRSVSCASGAPNPEPASWADDSGHGSNIAGVIGARANGVGIVGIAPKVRLAIVKASVPRNGVDVFLADAVVCSLVWAANNGVDVANNSYSTDSAYSDGTTSFCRDDPAQRTIVEAVRRAAAYAQGNGVTLVASAGNAGLDLGAPEQQKCIRLPSQLPGVVTVSSIGLDGRLAAGPPSNYGLGVVDVAAAGGDFLQGAPPSGLVLGPWPSIFSSAPRILCDPCEGPGAAYYAFWAGTSQAAAQASGVAALVVSRFGKNHPHGLWKMVPKRVAEHLRRTADPLPCPTGDARCVAAGNETSFFGHGVVNALRAVTNDRNG